MSKEEYAEHVRECASYYMKGRKDERKRIIKLIDEKIQECKQAIYGTVEKEIGILEELKEELTKK